MQPGDALHALIRQHVQTQVPTDQVEVVTRLTAYAITHMMNDAYFVNQLRVVNDLRAQNDALRQEVFKLRALFERAQPVTVRKPKRARKATKTSKDHQKAFQQGVSDLRGR